MTLYDQDYYAWTQTQAMLLKERDYLGLDTENLIEELESMGRSERREVISRLEQLVMHLLKWQFQPGFRGHSWRTSIRNQRRELTRVLLDNPSLRTELPLIYIEIYPSAVNIAEDETGLSRAVFPSYPPFTLEQALMVDWLPE
jgi:hypothetical protein